MSEVGKFIGLLISSREQAHVFHFTTRSKSVYKLMGVYYQDIVEIIDEYADTYMKKSGRRIHGLNPYINKKIVTDPRLIRAYFVNLLKTVRGLKLPREYSLDKIHREVIEILIEVIKHV